MKKPSKAVSLFWDTARNFLHQYLPEVRHVSVNTTASYRQSLNCYIDYLEKVSGIKRQKMTFDDFQRDSIKGYLTWMKDVKNLSAKTCNLRLTAIRSFLEYATDEDAELMAIYTSACTIKGLKEEKKAIEYLERKAMVALLQTPDTTTNKGKRNRMLLILLYDTASRVQEIVDIRLCDLHLEVQTPFVTLHGKGNKWRTVPLMEKSVLHLRQYLSEFHCEIKTNADNPLFYSVRDARPHKLSTDTVGKMLKKYALLAQETCLEMPLNVHCHMIRKTRAMDLYQEGVPLVHIMQLLGHENISTTSGFYAFATLETLKQSLRKVNPDLSKSEPLWKTAKSMELLYRL